MLKTYNELRTYAVAEMAKMDEMVEKSEKKSRDHAIALGPLGAGAPSFGASSISVAHRLQTRRHPQLSNLSILSSKIIALAHDVIAIAIALIALTRAVAAVILAISDS